MTRFLLDTHTLLWLVADDPQISAAGRRVVDHPDAQLVVSIASLWEMAIKISRGKLDLGCTLERFIQRVQEAGVTVWSLEPRHVIHLSTLPFHHSDPFDRVIAAQSILDELTLVSRDQVFDLYGVVRCW